MDLYAGQLDATALGERSADSSAQVAMRARRRLHWEAGALVLPLDAGLVRKRVLRTAIDRSVPYHYLAFHAEEL